MSGCRGGDADAEVHSSSSALSPSMHCLFHAVPIGKASRLAGLANCHALTPPFSFGSHNVEMQCSSRLNADLSSLSR